jgi:hypothetical protein
MTKLKHLSSSTEPKIQVMAIYANFKYFGNIWDKSLKTLIIFHKRVRGSHCQQSRVSRC